MLLILEFYWEALLYNIHNIEAGHRSTRNTDEFGSSLCALIDAFRMEPILVFVYN